jgi:hypothetical protein
MASVMFRIGDVLQSGADVTALPCSTKGHISSTAQAKVQHFQLPLPSLLALGNIEILRFPGRVSRIIAWAASVSDRRSSAEAIRSIGQRLGLLANESRWIQILESPLLGTGAGGLDPMVAGAALRDGFLETCSTDALLIVYGQIAATINALRGFVDDSEPTNAEEAPVTSDESGIDPIGMTRDAPGIFISYSHKDRKFLDHLRIHLKPLERIAVLNAWSDQQIAPGSEWAKEIQKALAHAKVAVLLVSPSFLASDFIHNQELAPLLAKAGRGHVKILWIPVRACSFEATSLRKYQAAIPPERPLAEMKANRDKAWVTICDEIKKALGRRTR